MRGIPFGISLIFLWKLEIRRSKCNSPVDCCLRGLDRATQLFLPQAKMQTNLQRVTSVSKHCRLKRKSPLNITSYREVATSLRSSQ